MSELREFKTKLEQAIKESDQVFITPHLNADFDAIASSIGFSLIATKFSKPNYIFMCDDPFQMDPGAKSMITEYQNQASFISLEKYLKLNSSNDLLIATDTNKSYLIGCKEYLENFKKIAILDHHKPDDNTIKSDLIYIPEKVSSASEIMTDLLCKFGIKFNETIATYLLTGIYLDTDKMKKGVFSKTFEMVAKLLNKGASLEKALDFLAEDFKNDQKISRLINLAQFYTYAITIEEEDILYTRGELAKTADKLLSYKSVDASFAVGKLADKIISMSARSKGKIDVSKIMAEFGGGGNIFSAAAQIENENIEEIKEELSKTLKLEFLTK